MRGRGNIFEDGTKLIEMLSLRQQGVGPSELGRRYGVDHTTIIYHCKRNGLVMPRGMQQTITSSGVVAQAVVITRTVGISVASGMPRVILDAHDGTPINPGRNYAEYLQHREQQRIDRLTKKKIS